MSDETPGVGQGALPPREGSMLSRSVAERPAMRLTQVAGGQYVLTTQSPGGVPALAQLSPANLGPNSSNLQQAGVTRIISISPSRSGHASTLRPSQANQSIVNVLTKPRVNTNLRLQLFQNVDGNASVPQLTPTSRSPLKRPVSTVNEKRDAYSAKLQRVMNHRIVRSKLVKEKYNEHLMELYFLETGGNLLDLHQFAKRPKTAHYLAYLKEHAVDPKEYNENISSNSNSIPIPQIVPSTPSATPVSSLPGISHSNSTVTTITESTPKNTPKQKTAQGNQEQIMEKAKQEAYVVQRISDLQKEGLWSEKRLPKLQEMPRIKSHWDYLLEEMVWLAADFAQERKWKKAAAKKCAKMVQKYFQDKALAAQRAEKAQEQHLKRIAAYCAKEIKNFWNNVEKLVEYKQNTILEEKRKKALDQQLSFIVDQTEKYSQLLAEGMNKSVNDSSQVEKNTSLASESRVNSDDEFQPDNQSSTDDEETIEQEEANIDAERQSEEVAALQKESEMDLEEFLKELPKDYLENRDKIKFSDEESDQEMKVNNKNEKEDADFKASSSEEDDEATIEEQEKNESSTNHEEELKDLEAENEMSIEELRKKYGNLPDVAENCTSESSSEDEESEKETEDSEDEVNASEDEKSQAGLELLLDDSKVREDKQTENDDLINDAAAIAESIQPKGNTLSSTNVSTTIPFLLKYSLREYQHIGLDWLVTMFERKLNGILADEMGLGKTIQTIALLAHLACEKENWGPHLIVVPTSVMLNWEMEFKKWCPGFKILTYYGSQKERKMKRTGWTKPNAFHICITSYKLVIQDHQSFRRKKWKYLILDEAQNIKNFKSQRWQLLLNFQTQQRLLLTGTPLQNNLMELWSLMHFLMPNVFQSHREFKEWFSNPVTGMIEGNNEYNENIIKRLHKVLRPFLLRRLKSEVEKQMPKKYEHVVMCRLSKRQRFLYDDYMSRAKTKETLSSGNLLSVINVLMQLRKVCNHPNLFEVRPTISPFQCEGVTLHIPSIIFGALEYDVWKHINYVSLNLNLLSMETYVSAYQSYRARTLCTPAKIIELNQVPEEIPPCPPSRLIMRIRKHDNDSSVKVEKKESNNGRGIHQNLKLKVGQPYSMQLVQQHGGIVKAIPVNIAQGATGISSANISNAASLLKTGDNKISASFAQLVQTSTGKHLLLTSTPNIAGTTSGAAQKLTLLSKHPVSTATNAQPLHKAFVKFQLTSVNAPPTNTLTTSIPKSGVKELPKVGSKFIEQLYSNQTNQNNLDVRWEDTQQKEQKESREIDMKVRLKIMSEINERRMMACPIYGSDLHAAIKITNLKAEKWCNGRSICLDAMRRTNIDSEVLKGVLYTPERRIAEMAPITDRFIFYVPSVNAPQPELQVWHPHPGAYKDIKEVPQKLATIFSRPTSVLHKLASARVTQFPDPRLIQYDCGKLQTLDKLLRKLKSEGHRVLIFTQMTKMLDVLEAFLNFHGHIYLRLDGTTKVDQRQILMERFNGDTRIFAFILSTRSGGVGVNLTGADTVIFYDSDWNPTMDAQAQDRCHRIGQTRDVHIYRLVSERTIEENILKKANQKRLLGDLAIEGGNFTTAYFKSSTIQDLFNIDNAEESAANRMSEVLESNRDRSEALARRTNSPNSTPGDEKVAIGALENALAACEDDQDVQAARTAKAEAVADLAEFDENIPLEEVKDKEPEISRAEQEIENVIKKLSPIERYAMNFIEQTESAWSAEQLAAAERLIEEQKLEWEQNRLAAMKEEEERRARELEEENDLLTFSREDANNQVWLSDNGNEQMPMWCPPTPPQQENDVYIDNAVSFLYETEIMTENQLPPVYVKKEAKRTRIEAGLSEGRRSVKIPRKEEIVNAPKSIFHPHALFKMRRDVKWQKYRNLIRPGISIPGKATSNKIAGDLPICHEWTIHEDMGLLKVIQNFQNLPINLMITSPAHTPNWDFVADYVNTVSITYRSPKQCRQRYDSVLMQREEGKQIYDQSMRKKKNKNSSPQKFVFQQQKSNRPMRTLQLYTQDNNSSFSQTITQKYDASLAHSSKPKPPDRTANNILPKNPKHTVVWNECGIDFDHPLLPTDVAVRRAERMAREKKMTTEARMQLMKGIVGQGQSSSTSAVSAVSTNIQNITPTQTAGNGTPAIVTVTAATTGTTAPSTPSTIRGQRIIASPLQSSTVVSVSNLSPAQLQAATQRLIVSANSAQTKSIVTGQGVQSKAISPAQLQMIRQAASLKQQVRLQTQGLKTSTVTIGGQATVVQFTQAQPRPQFVRQGTVPLGSKTAITRTDSEVAQILKKQQQLQQQKALAAAVASQSNTIQNLSPQVFAHAFQQAGTSGTPVATLVKTVSSSGVSQAVTIPIASAKSLNSQLKANPQQIRQLHIQQQLLAQKKLGTQKVSIAQVAGTKTNMQTQLIVGSKPLQTAMTVQQFQQVIRSPLGVSQGPVVLAKGTPRVIPVNTGPGTKQTIQVVAATSQGLSSGLRPQSSSTLAGALAGLKVQGQTASQTQQALLSHVSAALQSQSVGVRQGSPVRIQTSSGTPIVAVSVQSNSSIGSQSVNPDQITRFMKK
ncbi:helicase domino [Coccinella septempunctata]|uniref:helicase domino n=1 Tax=Coccinella septempunctata TaxID=41139 RepID=UPI001D095D30|nr:helicase domino [Coccinella septempunctata]XP_044753469.1 helicase domino [Coccinella septempunctata]